MISRTARLAQNLEVVDAPAHHKRTDAVLDRLLQSAQRVELQGESMRAQ